MSFAGIGGGVAIQALQLAVAAGANVWVTSGDKAKIDRAKSMGAKGGVSYKDGPSSALSILVWAESVGFS